MVIAYDGTPPSVAAIEIRATLLPSARTTVLHLWTPPFTSELLRKRLRERAGTAEQLRASSVLSSSRPTARLACTTRSGAPYRWAWVVAISAAS